jgi:hypothetical protein
MANARAALGAGVRPAGSRGIDRIAAAAWGRKSYFSPIFLKNIFFYYFLVVGFVPKWGGGGGSGGPHGRARGGSDARWPNRPMSWGGSAKMSEIMGCAHGQENPISRRKSRKTSQIAQLRPPR